MRLLEIINSYKIFVDLDGVLVDFDKETRWLGFPPFDNIEHDKKIKKEFWKKIGEMAKQGIPFWGNMDPMPDAMVLWNYVKKYNPEILSATGHVGNAASEKREWVKKYLGDVPVHLVQKSAEKAQFAAPNHILIDDRSKSIDPWVAAGGIGILHKNANTTIEKLKELGL